MNEFVSKEKHDADIDMLLVLIDKTNERINDVHQSTSRQISFWGIMTAIIAFLFAGIQIGIAITLYFLSLPK